MNNESQQDAEAIPTYNLGHSVLYEVYKALERLKRGAIMNIDVDRKDLVTLMHGVEPTYEQMEIPVIAKNGRFNGSYGTWNWTGSFKELDDQELYKLYIDLKTTGFKSDEKDELKRVDCEGVGDNNGFFEL